MSLSVIIPAHNPDINFFRTVELVTHNYPEWQVIIVDDGSSKVLEELCVPAANLSFVRNDAAKGAGFSRNRGIAEVTGDYVVFMDDDDFMDWKVVSEIVDQMGKMPEVDVVLASYQFLLNGILSEAYPRDNQIMRDILRGKSARTIGIDGNEDLLRFINFPWNKVYRVDFIRRIGLRFSETKVQNDIYAHWQSLLCAKRILVTDQVLCTKDQNDSGGRVSNTADYRRLEAFIALRETYEFVRQQRLPRVETRFWAFYIDLVRWMIRVSTRDTGPLLLCEHMAFVGAAPPDILYDLEVDTGIKSWELWEVNGVARIVEEEVSGSIDLSEDLQRKMILSELSRLKQLAAELRKDNDRIRQKLNQAHKEKQRLKDDAVEMQRHLDSKAARWAFKIRSAYRSVIR
ncbi:hypothetical protein DL1_18195 [Thioclava dalianensis]|uniref:Glycosyltransferase 2-like domain-containing protein n=1 Tax=Thioclava dalianensis TaxID=1185766 RepID=A0A074T7Y7_9RHOB|nr:glycosyltransferase family 2 protein [Thioclava dalianensis]KEP67911.1 hypothetical protein DL1_18195 [Thioclava dalianensis]SFN16514.1 Glycosyltransferase involved in cell wall bisynthesis [Thioclava dalianensis]